MDLSFNNTATSAARYAFGNHDRVTIQGQEYRPHSFNEEGWLMSSMDGNGLCVQFPHEKLRALGAAGRIRHEPGYHDPQKAARRVASEVNSLSGLDEKPRNYQEHGATSAGKDALPDDFHATRGVVDVGNPAAAVPVAWHHGSLDR